MGRSEDNIVLKKSMDFAVRIVRLHKYLSNEKKGICPIKAVASLRNICRR